MGRFPCPRCRMAFSSRQLLRAHQEKLCLGITEPASSCLHGGNPLPVEGAPGTAGRPQGTSVRVSLHGDDSEPHHHLELPGVSAAVQGQQGPGWARGAPLGAVLTPCERALLRTADPASRRPTVQQREPPQQPVLPQGRQQPPRELLEAHKRQMAEIQARTQQLEQQREGPPSTSTPSCHPWGHSLPRPGHCDCPTCVLGDTTRPSWTSCSTSSWRPQCWRKEPRGCAGAGGWGLDAALLAVELENWRLEDEVLALKVRRERRADAGSRAAQWHSEELAQLRAEVGMLRCHAEQAGPRLPPPILPPTVAPPLPPALAVPELFTEPPGPALGPGSPTAHVPHSLPLSTFVALEDPPPAQEPPEQHKPPRRLLDTEGGTPRTHSRFS
ncbi:coiled-coil domain-containing protein 17 isoform X6 [Chiroxiphia lanceolata]|uniref:coiled-coil domain-containing protein 17 isoform X6 n=1 Tax=Chiroxiphia lanceolata TaxID=296741 RepID=UPI0013CF07EB|nr:coiled-coil domain-containing protein 17 isoform X6 [Chiroxiphia lanceolata]